MTTLSRAAFSPNSRGAGDYATTRLNVVPEARETDALKRRQGRYRRQRTQALEEIQQDPHGKPPTWRELRYEVKELRKRPNYDSEQEDEKRQETKRKIQHAEYGKRQEARRREQKPY